MPAAFVNYFRQSFVSQRRKLLSYFLTGTHRVSFILEFRCHHRFPSPKLVLVESAWSANLLRYSSIICFFSLPGFMKTEQAIPDLKNFSMCLSDFGWLLSVLPHYETSRSKSWQYLYHQLFLFNFWCGSPSQVFESTFQQTKRRECTSKEWL